MNAYAWVSYAWIATSVCLAGTALNVKRIDVCFILWAIGETMWIGYDASRGLVSRTILDAVGLAFALWGAWENLYIKRKRKN